MKIKALYRNVNHKVVVVGNRKTREGRLYSLTTGAVTRTAMCRGEMSPKSEIRIQTGTKSRNAERQKKTREGRLYSLTTGAVTRTAMCRGEMSSKSEIRIQTGTKSRKSYSDTSLKVSG